MYCKYLELQQEIKETKCLNITKSDSSVYPSYTNIVLPYRVKCRRRYFRDTIKYNKQFIKEISTVEALQQRAFDGVRVHRIFCNPMISPPEPDKSIRLTPNEKRRLEEILSR